jgi:hypothetical protein
LLFAFSFLLLVGALFSTFSTHCAFGAFRHTFSWSTAEKENLSINKENTKWRTGAVTPWR